MEEVLSGVKSIYLVGIGGVGMSGLAFLLKEKGFNIQGSDLCEGSYVQCLREEGVKVVIGHKKENLPQGVNLIVYSSAVKENNPEILEAKRRNITVLKRGELLGLLSWDRKTIAVAGSHGKTTTSALIGYVLTCLGYEPAVFVGGVPLNYSRTAWWGKEHFVIETDESDGSFLCYNPWVSIITNIDSEHLDYYKNIDNLKESFRKFAYQTKDKVFGCGDDPFVREILAHVRGWSFGWTEGSKIRGGNFTFDGKMSCFDVFSDEKLITAIKIPLLGKVNALNVLAAIAFFRYMDVDLAKVSKVLETFKGTKRRFQIKDIVRGVTFVDDYAHHPTEIKAVLRSAQYLSPRRVVVVFQPHRFSRVKLLYKEFLHCFSLVDELIVTDIYSASETGGEEIDIKTFTEEIKRNFSGKVSYVPCQKLKEEVPLSLREGDLCLGIGAGDINILMDEVFNEFRDSAVKQELKR